MQKIPSDMIMNRDYKEGFNIGYWLSKSKESKKVLDDLVKRQHPKSNTHMIIGRKASVRKRSYARQY